MREVRFIIPIGTLQSVHILILSCILSYSSDRCEEALAHVNWMVALMQVLLGSSARHVCLVLHGSHQPCKILDLK